MKLHLIVEHKGKVWKFRIHHYSYAFPIWIIAVVQLWIWLIPVGFIMLFSDFRDFYNDFKNKIYKRIRNKK